jgi:hypothetical protein
MVDQKVYRTVEKKVGQRVALMVAPMVVMSEFHWAAL